MTARGRLLVWLGMGPGVTGIWWLFGGFSGVIPWFILITVLCGGYEIYARSKKLQ